jgi:anti-sigma regulatory factor (Ser/Thr protein kinase)
MEPRATERTFGARATSVAGARRFVVYALEGVDTDIAVVELLTAELAANAVLHADSEFRVRVLEGSRSVRVEIVNDKPELLLSLKAPSDEGGRGLHILTTLAQDWGTESSRDEKVVWFEVPTGAGEDASIDA